MTTGPISLTRADGGLDTLEDPTPERVGEWVADNVGCAAFYDRCLPDDEIRRISSSAIARIQTRIQTGDLPWPPPARSEPTRGTTARDSKGRLVLVVPEVGDCVLVQPDPDKRPMG